MCKCLIVLAEEEAAFRLSEEGAEKIMAKEPCVVCGNRYNRNDMIKLKDGYACATCLSRLGIPYQIGDLDCNSAMIFRTQKYMEHYEATDVVIQRVFELDDIHDLFRVEGSIFKYSSLVNFKTSEKEVTPSSGFNFGKNKKAKRKEISIQIDLKDEYTDSAFITLSPEYYEDNLALAQKCMNALSHISEVNRKGGHNLHCMSCERSVESLYVKKLNNNAYLCEQCLYEAGMPFDCDLDKFSIEEINSIVSRRRKVVPQYQATRIIIENNFEVDERHDLFKVNNIIFEYSNLLSFNPIENGKTQIVNDGLGALGTLVGGVSGAIVGSALQDQKLVKECSQLQIRLMLKDTYLNDISIDFITPEKGKNINTDDPKYLEMIEQYRNCVAILQTIDNKNKVKEQTSASNVGRNNYSAADEILKYKNLLDIGAITQEEYDAKKKQLLGL